MRKTPAGRWVPDPPEPEAEPTELEQLQAIARGAIEAGITMPAQYQLYHWWYHFGPRPHDDR